MGMPDALEPGDIGSRADPPSRSELGQAKLTYPALWTLVAIANTSTEPPGAVRDCQSDRANFYLW
jgi:hypothetical protein